MLNKDIPHFARQIAETYGGSSGSMLKNIAQSAGIKIIKDSDVCELEPTVYGLCLSDGKKYVIIYDDSQTPEEKSFTVAHELGHALLNHREDHARLMEYIEQLKEKHGRRAERQADIFAKSLLRARKELRKE